MTVIELARRAGVTADTVRHYTRSGLLIPQRDGSNGYNRYSSSDLARLLFIRKAKQLGFSLEDIRQILKESGHGQSPCPHVRKIMEQRIREVRSRIRDLRKLQKRMEQAVELWSHLPDALPDGNAVCHLIEKISMEA